MCIGGIIIQLCYILQIQYLYILVVLEVGLNCLHDFWEKSHKNSGSGNTLNFYFLGSCDSEFKFQHLEIKKKKRQYIFLQSYI